MSIRNVRRVCAVAVWPLLFASAAEARIVINEVHYHPANDAVQAGEDAEGLQFVELHNDGAAPEDLSGVSFSAGLTFAFPAGTQVPAGGYVVVAQDPALLALRGPPVPAGVDVFRWSAGILGNGGETLRLVDANAVVLDEITYDDAAPWPGGADGLGATLELTNPGYDNTLPLVWRASPARNGTPGAANGAFTEGPVVAETDPASGAVAEALNAVSVTFAEPVSGVVAGDLVVDGSAAAAVACPTCAAGVGAGPWIFTGFAAPQSNPSVVALGAGAIRDANAHAFAGASWNFVLSVPRIVINELHYNPLSSTDDEEFIEIVNADDVPVDVSGWQILEFGSPGCLVPAGTILAPGAFLVCAKNPDALAGATGYVGALDWGAGDSLSNGGEPVALVDTNGTIVDRLEYDDSAPWPEGPEGPDGNGPSAELVNPGMDNAQGTAWRTSAAPNGTPGAANSVFDGAPALASVDPGRGAIVLGLDQISVTFTEPVFGVVAEDLTLVDPISGDVGAATAVVGDGAGPYVFTVDPPAGDVVEVILGSGAIVGAQGAPFGSDWWRYYTRLPAININEIHYNPTAPAGQNADALQFIELYNAEANAVDLSGFTFTEGIAFIFPEGTTIKAREHIVIAANPAALRAAVAVPANSQIFQWTSGELANSGEKLELSDAWGHVIDAVRYDDAGEWTDEPDGRGPSLELVNPAVPNDLGGAWQGSAAANGTPCAVNSRFVRDPAPIIVDVHHFPSIPRAGQRVTITASVVDDDLAPPTVSLYTRPDRDPPAPYARTAMFDDGLHGDGAAGDGRFGAFVGGLADGQQLDFYVDAVQGRVQTVAPAGHAVPDVYGNPSQTFLAKFSDEILPVDQPTYHLLVTQANKVRQEALAGYPQRKQSFDATFIDGHGNIWYNVTERYRGQSSLFRYPSSYRVDFPRNRKLDSVLGFPVESLQLNGMRPASQFLMYELFNRAGLLAPRAAWAHVRYTGINYDTCCNGQNGYWGLHVVVERLDDEFLDSQNGAVPQRPTSSEGNLYRGRNDANLRWEGPNPATYGLDANGQNGYEKYNNSAANDWSDLISLTDAVSNTPDDQYVAHLRAHVDEDNWARYFAMQMLLGNREGGLYLDTGDDYFFYIPPPNEPKAPPHPGVGTAQLPDDRRVGRSRLIAWDSDSVMQDANYSIWRTAVPAAQRFLRHNAYAPIFVQAIEDFARNEYSAATMARVLDSMPDAAFPRVAAGSDVFPETRAQFKAWHANRLAYVANQTRDALTLDGGPRFTHFGAQASFRLQGQIQQAGTHNVTVNGRPATFSVFNGTWSHDFPLVVGPNHAVIEAWDRAGRVKQRVEADVFYNPAGAPDELRLSMRAPTRMINDKVLTVEAAIQDPVGRIDYTRWDVLGSISAVRLPERTPVAITPTVFDAHAPMPDDSIRFLNGWGSVSFTLDEGAGFAPGDIEVAVSWEGLRATRTVRVLKNPVYRSMSGNLVGANLVWGPDETIRITAGTTVPAGSTLTIHPGTIIQVDTTGVLTQGTLIVVQGALQALGTAERPVYFFSERGAAAMTLTQAGSSSNPNAWRGFQFRGAGRSTMRHVFLTGAGNGSVVSHPRPPILGLFETHGLTVDRSVFADAGGMVFSGQGTGTYLIRKTLVNRVGIGGEFFGNGHTLTIRDTWFTAIGHAPEGANLDGDLLHIDGNRSTQLIRGCIIQDGGDDGIDHNGSNFRLEHSILWRIRDKAISMTGGRASVFNTLMFNAATGIRGFAATDYTTIATPGPIAAIDAVRTTIVWPSSIPTCGANVNYSDIGDPAQLGCGQANFSADPQFVSTAARDYNPRPGSPALTAGPNQDRIGWLGFPYGAVCSVSADCNDQNGCTRDECVDKLCRATAIVGCTPCDFPEDCDDANPCTADTCEADGSCRHAPMPDGTACADARACTGPDVCTAGTCGGAVNCPAGRGCDAVGACLPPIAPCVNDRACDDGLFCNGSETCNVGTGACVAGVAPTCDDAVSCTADACNELTDTCDHAAQDVRCDDGNVCTDDVCDAALDCRHADNTALCDDGDPCTDADVCGGGACGGGVPADCDDGLDCTADRCEPAVGCAHDSVCAAEEVCAIGSGTCEPAPTTVTFRDGENGYSGSFDTYLDALRPGESFGAAPVLSVSGDAPPVGAQHILIRFDDLFGWDPGQIPPGARIDAATLTLHIEDPSDDGATLHRMLAAWDDDDSWNARGEGIQTEDVEALETPEARAAVLGADRPVDLDVTASVAEWARGGTNWGWAMVMANGGSDVWTFGASESAEPTHRPTLSVTYLACPRGFEGDGVNCTDVDECAADPGPCDAHATCENTEGSFTCTCDAGYAGDGFTCADIDECAGDPAPCDADATCLNGDGVFECACNAGFTGDGFTCEDIDECAADPAPCGPHMACENAVGSYACPCLPGYEGAACDACAVGFAGYPDCTLCADCAPDDPCATDADCDDGNPCTAESCGEARLCRRSLAEGPCDDGSACTSDDACNAGACVGAPIMCDDGDRCTTDLCDPALGCQAAEIGACCRADADCALGEGCFEGLCRAVYCEGCADDAACGGGANRCLTFENGTTACGVGCAGEGAECPEGSACRELEAGDWQCTPLANGCDCEPQAGVACQDGQVVFLDSCANPGDLAVDCGGRGCADLQCCPPGTVESEGACVATDAGVSPPDAGGLPADAGAQTPDAGAGGAGGNGGNGGNGGEVGGAGGNGGEPGGSGGDGGASGGNGGATGGTGSGGESGGAEPPAGGRDGGGPEADATAPDGGTRNISSGGDPSAAGCGCRTGASNGRESGAWALLLLLAPLAARRRRGRGR